MRKSFGSIARAWGKLEVHELAALASAISGMQAAALHSPQAPIKKTPHARLSYSGGRGGHNTCCCSQECMEHTENRVCMDSSGIEVTTKHDRRG